MARYVEAKGYTWRRGDHISWYAGEEAPHLRGTVLVGVITRIISDTHFQVREVVRSPLTSVGSVRININQIA